MVKKGTFSSQAAGKDHLPFPPLTTLQVRAVLEAFRLAWSHFLEMPEPHGIANVLEATEVQISDALLAVISTIHNTTPPPIPAFTEFFQTPVSDESMSNFDNSKPITKVDFCFRPKVNPYPGRNPRPYGLFVEAKPVIDGGVSNYMRKGLIKFQIGDYAWATTQGMMVAYVRPTNRELLDALNKYFKRHGVAEEFGLTAPPHVWPKDRRRPRAYTTSHERTWQYPPPNPHGPGDIEIIHLWLPMKQEGS